MVEVLRGRRIALSFGGADVMAWHLVSGECVALAPLAGGPAELFVGRWDRLAPPGQAWVTRFAIVYEMKGMKSAVPPPNPAAMMPEARPRRSLNHFNADPMEPL